MKNYLKPSFFGSTFGLFSNQIQVSTLQFFSHIFIQGFLYRLQSLRRTSPQHCPALETFEGWKGYLNERANQKARLFLLVNLLLECLSLHRLARSPEFKGDFCMATTTLPSGKCRGSVLSIIFTLRNCSKTEVKAVFVFMLRRSMPNLFSQLQSVAVSLQTTCTKMTMRSSGNLGGIVLIYNVCREGEVAGESSRLSGPMKCNTRGKNANEVRFCTFLTRLMKHRELKLF